MWSDQFKLTFKVKIEGTRALTYSTENKLMLPIIGTLYLHPEYSS